MTPFESIHGSSTLRATTIAKKNATGWNHLVRISTPLSGRRSVHVTINNYLTGMFICLASLQNRSESGYFDTVGIYGNNILKTTGIPIYNFDHNFTNGSVVGIEIDFGSNMAWFNFNNQLLGSGALRQCGITNECYLNIYM